MAFSTKLFLTLLALPVLLVFTRLYNLFRNYLAARKIGLPIVISLESWQDPLWIFFGSYVRKSLSALGLWDRSEPDYTTIGWPIYDRYDSHAKYGPAFSIVTPFKTNVIVAENEAARELFKEWRVWIKNRELYAMMESFGKNVNSVNGDDWRRHRKVTAPAFKEANSKLVWNSAMEQANGLSKRWNENSKKSGGITLRELRGDANIVAMHVLAAATFNIKYDFEGGVEVSEPGHEMSYGEAMKTIVHNLSMMLVPIIFGLARLGIPSWMMPAGLKRLKVAVFEIQNYLESYVAQERKQYREGGESRDDLMSSLVRANEAEKEKLGTEKMKWALSDEELYGNLFMFNQAGHETTSSALSYAIPFLAAYPGVQEWIREEVDAIFRNGDVPYAAAMPRLVRCDALMYETIRFFSAVPMHPKYTGNISQVLSIAGHDHVIPAHTFVSINYYAIHFNPSTWGSDVNEFRPSRFIKSSLTPGTETFAIPEKADFIGWSSGPRVCPGKKFSQVEFVATIVRLLREFVLKPAQRAGESEETAGKRLVEVMSDVEHFISAMPRHPDDAGFVCIKRARWTATE
ncbi:cytochrome P450 [Rhizodiscina lignyota]|uniref:Cytochrome P450 n=1 Tax=Rhizodiscina lignyota TaxID=1504668 RepID=A0A9P4I6D8_9PEZI|nr:cytochrome P450 [Rhizodiscina lignyota]